MKKLSLIALIIGVGISAHAQINSLTSLQYSVGFGTGDVGTFISKPSFRGATFDWRKFVTDNVAVGLEVGWNVFYEAKGSDTYTIGNVSLTGKQYRYQNQVPMLFNTTYFLTPGDKVCPFFGLGLGTMYSRRNTDMNVYTIEEQAWHFAVKPEIGILYQFNSETSAFIALKFYNGLSAGDFKVTQSYLSLNVGLAFTK